MKNKLIFDVSMIAAHWRKPRWQAGLFRYASELLKALSVDPRIEFFPGHIAYPRNIRDSKKLLLKNNIQNKLSNYRESTLPISVAGRAERYFNKIYSHLNWNVDTLSYREDVYSTADIFHTPFLPIPLEVKRYPKLKRFVTIHDLIPLYDPDYSLAGKNRMQKIINSVGSDHVICVSNHTRNDLLNHDSRIDPKKVFVAHLAADPEKFYPASNPGQSAAVREKYGLPEKYFLSLCTLEPRKNLDHLIRGFRRFVLEKNAEDLHLVLAGPLGWEYEKFFAEINDSGPLKNRIIYTGRVADEDLATLYSNALAFYFVSLYEGFGLPPLEAMQCGTPTVVSNVSSLPEVVGEGGVLISPTDEDALCQNMYDIYSNAGYRKALKEKGLFRAKNFSWKKCAEEHIKAYQL